MKGPSILGTPEIQRLKLGGTVFNIKMSHCTKFQISSNLATVGVKTQNLQRFNMEWPVSVICCALWNWLCVPLSVVLKNLLSLFSHQ